MCKRHINLDIKYYYIQFGMDFGPTIFHQNAKALKTVPAGKYNIIVTILVN